MPRPIVLSNNRLFIGIDKHAAVRDLCWPNVGYPNHLVDGGIRLGVWVDNQFSWLDANAWHITQFADPNSNSAQTIATSQFLQVTLQISDEVATSDSWTRAIEIKNNSEHAREIRLFQTHNLRIDESDIGDTAMVCQDETGTIHYKNGKFLTFTSDQKVDYACGIKAWEGREGTWRDAEDGHLSKKPIEQGSVDSTIGITSFIQPNESTTVSLRFMASHSLPPESKVNHQPKGLTLPQVSEDEFINSSLRYVLAHCDQQGGILAACDSDIMTTARANYNYVWFRDGALTAHTLAQYGQIQRAQSFWEFFLRCVQDQPYSNQKYTVTGQLGASWLPAIYNNQHVLPFQQDESALPIWLALKLNLKSGEETIVRFLDHMVSYTDQNGLPLPSWDLWEERRGIHFFTVATVISALREASNSGLRQATLYGTAADRMAEAVEKHFWQPNENVIARTLSPTVENQYHADTTPDSSLLLGLMHGDFHFQKDWLQATASQVSNHLSIQTPVGGIARYSNDFYFRRSDDYPGNPWVICTLWLARAQMLLEPSRRQEIYNETIGWCKVRSESTHVLAEQFHPETGEPLSVSPLTWSHAEILETALLNQRLKSVD